MYDIAIIGAGPAGLSAAITARARNKEVLVVSNAPQESPLAKALLVDNYPGMPQTSGAKLLETMMEQALDQGARFTHERVISVVPIGEHFLVSMGDKTAEAKTVILAIGTQATKPFVGEAEFLGRGVSYCATCDGMLYRNMAVCVVGLNNEAAQEANFLSELGAKVTFLAKKPPLGLSEKIDCRQGLVAEIKGDMMGVTELVYTPASKEEPLSIACSGVFVLRPSIAPNALVAGLKLDGAFIAVDEAMRTSVPGVFAAGDCVGKPLQIAKAVGEGQIACFSAVELLQ